VVRNIRPGDPLNIIDAISQAWNHRYSAKEALTDSTRAYHIEVAERYERVVDAYDATEEAQQWLTKIVVFFVAYEFRDNDGVLRGAVSDGYDERAEAEKVMRVLLRTPEIMQARLESSWVDRGDYEEYREKRDAAHLE